MKFNKVFIFIFLLMISLVCVNAIDLNDNLIFGSHFNLGTATDWSGVSGGGTVVSATPTTDKNSIANQALYFNGADDWVLAPTLFSSPPSAYSQSVWFKADSLVDGYIQYSEDSNLLNIMKLDLNKLTIGQSPAGGGFVEVDISFTDTTNWHNVIMVFDGSKIEGYLDGVSFGTASISTLNTGGSGVYAFGAKSTGIHQFEGKIDEPRIWIRALNAIEILKVYNLYDKEDSVTPYLEFTNIKANNISLVNNSFYNSSINFETIILNTSTNGDVNNTYNLTNDGSDYLTFYNPIHTEFGVTYGLTKSQSAEQYCKELGYKYISNTDTAIVFGSETLFEWYFSPINWDTTVVETSKVTSVTCNANEVQYATNSLTGDFNVTLPSGNYNISFYGSNDETNITSSIYSLIVDTIKPTFTDSVDTTEINSYYLNVTGIECVDLNIDYCKIIIESVEYNLLAIDEITLINSGNITYTLSSRDLAGNTNVSSGVVFVNPYQYFYFEKSGIPITNFIFGGVEFTDYAKFKLYDDNLNIGSNSLTWNKTGYVTQTINFTLTLSSAVNTTYEVTHATIFVNIYDKNSGEFITGITTVEFISTIGLKTNTTNGSLVIYDSLFQADTYTIIITNPDYVSENVYFTFTNVENVVIDAYLTLNTTDNAGILQIKVLDNLGQPIQGASVYAKQWFSDSSSFITTSQALTDISGKTQLNVLLNDKVYILSASYEDSSVGSIQQTFYTINTETEIVLTLIPSSTIHNIYFLDNIISSAEEDFNELTNISTISFTWEDVNNEGATGCINTYRSINGQTTRINPPDCFSSPATTFIKAYTLNTSQDIVFRAEMLIDGKYYPVASFVHNSEQNPATFLKNIGLDIMIVPLLFLISVVVGIASKNMFIGSMLMMIIAGMSLSIAPGVLTGGVVAFCFIIGGIIMYGANR